MEALAAAMLEEDTSDGGVTVGDWAVGEASSGGQKSREPPIPVGPGVCHAPPWLWKNELMIDATDCHVAAGMRKYYEFPT